MKALLRFILLKLSYPFWRLRHPFAPYHRYYVHRVNKWLKRGLPHCSLGADYTNTNLGEFTMLLEKFHLQPDQRCIDYGCGSLRIGKHLIAYLNAGNYLATDVTDQFYLEGCKTIDKSLLKEKEPVFVPLDKNASGVLHEFKADYLICNSVLYHIPPNEIEDFLKSIIHCMCEHTLAVITFTQGSDKKNLAGMTWTYAPETLLKIAQSFGVSAEWRNEESLNCFAHDLLILSNAKAGRP